jgi:hypothetical protein
MDTGRSDDGDRLFAIQGHSDDFFAGVLADGRQVLMGFNVPDLVAYFFSPEGVLLGRDTRLLEGEPPRPGGVGPYLTRDPTYRESVRRQVARWQEDLGFRPATIHVRAFTADFVKVEAMPSRWLEVDPDEPDEGREEYMRANQEWEAAGDFVLWWDDAYYMSKDGEVVST